jgi:hypothetical protein
MASFKYRTDRVITLGLEVFGVDSVMECDGGSLPESAGFSGF